MFEAQGRSWETARAKELFDGHLTSVYKKRDRVIASLMIAQCIFAIAVAFIYSPRTWYGTTPAIHTHVYYALIVGPALSAPVVLLTIFRPGSPMTRYTAAISQMLWSGLLIHLTNGRIETHFHVFGSLAVIAYYRDWKLMIPATITVSLDHLLRGIFWPESIYGVPNPEWYRFMEHAFWVILEDIVLVLAILENVREMRALAQQRAQLEAVNATIEKKVADRTDELRLANTALEDRMTELKKTQSELLATSRRAGMAEVAIGVLHNIGNVLNSVNIATDMVESRVRTSKILGMSKVIDLMSARTADLANYLSQDEKGKKLPAYLFAASKDALREREELLREVGELRSSMEHMKSVVSMQQRYAKGGAGVKELTSLQELVEDALRMSAESATELEIRRDFEELPTFSSDKHVILQILVNLLRNAKHALLDSSSSNKELAIRVFAPDDGRAAVEVRDNGVGISPENMARLFSHGFTTKDDGHGFGLHMSALAAKSLGGSLTCSSDGLGRGASFVFELPARTENEVRS